MLPPTKQTNKKQTTAHQHDLLYSSIQSPAFNSTSHDQTSKNWHVPSGLHGMTPCHMVENCHWIWKLRFPWTHWDSLQLWWANYHPLCHIKKKQHKKTPPSSFPLSPPMASWVFCLESRSFLQGLGVGGIIPNMSEQAPLFRDPKHSPGGKNAPLYMLASRMAHLLRQVGWSWKPTITRLHHWKIPKVPSSKTGLEQAKAIARQKLQKLSKQLEILAYFQVREWLRLLTFCMSDRDSSL